MWFKTNKHRILLISLSGVVVGGFGCSQDRLDSMAATAAEHSVNARAVKPQEVKVEILLKDDREVLGQSVEEAPAATMPSATQPTYMTQSQMMNGAAAYGSNGYTAGGLYAGADVPLNPGLVGPDVFGAGLGYPWFGPGFPFITDELLLFDDDDRRDDDNHHRRHRDNGAEDDNNDDGNTDDENADDDGHNGNNTGDDDDHLSSAIR